MSLRKYKIWFFALLSITSICAEVNVNYIHTLNSNRSVTVEDIRKNPHGYSVDEVIYSLREMDAKYASSHSEVLIRLKDQQTIDKYINRFIESKGADVQSSNILTGSRAPWLIPLLMKQIGNKPIESSNHPLPERAFYYGLSGSSLRTVHIILMRSPDLPAEVNSWASSINIRGEAAMNAARDTYQKWWELNKAAFDSEDYSKVVPLDDAREDEIIPAKPIANVAKEITKPGLATEESLQVVTIESSEEPAEQSPNWWLWLIGAVVVIGGLGLILRRKS